MDFDYSTVQNRWWYGGFEPGKGISDIVVNELVQEGSFAVIERKQLESIIAEQKFGMSGLVDPSAAAQVGRIVGAQAVVIGSITQFNLDTKKKFDLGGLIKVKTTTVTVHINARLIDTTTSEIIAVGEGKAEVSRTGVKADITVIEFGNKEFEKTVLGEATSQAVSQLVKQLTKSKPPVETPREGHIKAKVAYVEEGLVIIDIGNKKSGITVGQTLYIVKLKKEIKSPTTGEIIETLYDVIAEIKVTRVDENSSRATIIKGNVMDIKEGDDITSYSP